MRASGSRSTRSPCGRERGSRPRLVPGREVAGRSGRGCSCQESHASHGNHASLDRRPSGSGWIVRRPAHRVHPAHSDPGRVAGSMAASLPSGVLTRRLRPAPGASLGRVPVLSPSSKIEQPVRSESNPPFNLKIPGNFRTGAEISPAFVARARRCRGDKAHGPKEREPSPLSPGEGLGARNISASGPMRPALTPNPSPGGRGTLPRPA